MEFHRFECDCSSFHHNIRMILDPQDGTVYFDISMNTYLPWYKRVWYSIKYVLGLDCKYGHYDSTILKFDDYDKIRNILDKSDIIFKQNGI